MLLGHAVVFAVALARWWPHVGTSFPLTTHLYDAQLIIWALAWVSHALSTAPSTVFEANINWPAPMQLTGSEHFLSHQVVFSPVSWATTNPLLAANVTTWVWYPTSATLFAIVVLRCGAKPLAAWTCGCLFALGPLRVPLSLQTLQYPNALFPLLAVALSRLREQPSTGRAVVVSVSIVFALVTSLYGAVLAMIGAMLWGIVELARPLPSRGRFVLHCGWAAAMGGGVAAAMLAPYLTRAALDATPGPRALPLPILLWGVRWDELAPVVLAAAAWMVGAPRGPARTLLGSGALVLVTSAIVLLTQAWTVEIVAGSPLAFYGGWFRFNVLGGFGTALLATGALQVAYERWGVVAGRIGIAIVLLCVVSPRLVALATFETYEPIALTERLPAYRAISAIVARADPGPLLELPLARPGRARGEPRLTSLEPDAMLGSTVHWLPLVSGFTGYQPQHRRVVTDLVRRLPSDDALADLVDITHVDWILLRPVDDWSSRERVRRAMQTAAFIGEAREIDGFTLLRVEREAHDRHWIDSIRRAMVTPGEFSSLGTALRPLAEHEAVAIVSAPVGPTRLRAGQAMPLLVGIRNAGSADWPVARPRVLRPVWPRPPLGAHVVHLEEAWQPIGTSTLQRPERATHSLRRDVRAGESIRQAIRLRAPRRPGHYELVLRITQSEGADFVTPPSVQFRRRYEIRPGRVAK